MIFPFVSGFNHSSHWQNLQAAFVAI